MESEEDIEKINEGIRQIQAEMKRLQKEMEKLISAKKKIANKRPISALTENELELEQPPPKMHRRNSQMNLDLQQIVEVATEKENQDNEENNPDKEKENEETKQDMTNSDKNEGWMTKQFKKKRVPPIYIYGLKDWMSLAKLLKELLTEDFSAQSNPDSIKLQVKTPDDYRTATKYMEEERIEFHTYNIDKTKQIKVVIKGLPPTIPTATVKTELEALGYEPSFVGQLKDQWGTPISIYQVTLPMSSKAKEIYELNKVCYSRIRVEKYNQKKDLIQCHRCQRFGHTQSTCRAAPRCVKCAKDHLTKDCKKIDSIAACCINCGGKHPASYRGCEFYTHLKKIEVNRHTAKAKKTSMKKITQDDEETTAFTPRWTQGPRNTYANMVKKPNAESKQTQSDSGVSTQLLTILQELQKALKKINNGHQQ